MNKRTLIDYCSIANWNSILTMQDPEDATNAFINIIQNGMSKATKKFKKKKSNDNIPRKGWITPAILKSINKKNHLEKLWKNSKYNNTGLSNDKDNLIKQLEINYKNYNKRLNVIINCAKKNYEDEIVKKCDTIKKLWQ